MAWGISGLKSGIEPEYADHFDAWSADPTPETVGPLLGALKPVITSAVSAYGGPKASPILIGRAKQIVLDVLPKYTPKEGKLKPFLLSHLQGLRRIQAGAARAVRVPERTLADRATLTRTTADLFDELGRDPSDSELSARTRMPVSRISAVRKATTDVSNSGYFSAADPEASDPAVVDDGPGLREKFVYHGLGPEDQLVMEHTLGMYGKPTLGTGELARRLKITAGAVSQRKARIQRLLDETKVPQG